MDKKEFIRNEIKHKAFVRFPSSQFGKNPGERYDTQYYMSRVLYDTTVMEAISDCFFSQIEEHVGHWDFQLAGRAWSSIPLLSGIPAYLLGKYGKKINAFMVRPERKSYGLNNFTEGLITAQPVLCVDDLMNSDNGMAFTKQVVQAEMEVQTIPFVFAVLNKHGKHHIPFEFDKFVGETHKGLWIVCGDDMHYDG